MSWERKTYQKLSTVLKNQPDGWLWDNINQNFAQTVKTEVENYFYERYINSTNPETFKRYFTTYANMYYIPFMKMYDTFMADFDPLITRIYHESYNNNTLRDNTHNTTNSNTQTNNLIDKTTRTDDLKQTSNGTNTRTDNLKQTSSGTNTRTDDLTQTTNNTSERNDNLDQSTSHTGTDTTTNQGTTDSHIVSSDTIEQNNKNLHSDMPQSNVSSSTTGFPNVTWTYASDMQDSHNQSTNTGNSTTTNTQDLTNVINYNSDIMVTNTGTQTITNNGSQKNTGTQSNETSQTTDNTGTQSNETSQTTNNTGTQTTNAEHTGDIQNNGTSNLKIDDDEKTNGQRDIKEQSITATEAYQNYWSYLRNSNAWVWLMSKLDDCFLGILSCEYEDEYEAGYVFIS